VSRRYQHSVRGGWGQEMSALCTWGLGTGNVRTQEVGGGERSCKHSVWGGWGQEMSALSTWGLGTGDVSTQYVGFGDRECQHSVRGGWGQEMSALTIRKDRNRGYQPSFSGKGARKYHTHSHTNTHTHTLSHTHTHIHTHTHTHTQRRYIIFQIQFYLFRVLATFRIRLTHSAFTVTMRGSFSRAHMKFLTTERL
jgi:hypothetical protein